MRISTVSFLNTLPFLPLKCKLQLYITAYCNFTSIASVTYCIICTRRHFFALIDPAAYLTYMLNFRTVLHLLAATPTLFSNSYPCLTHIFGSIRTFLLFMSRLCSPLLQISIPLRSTYHIFSTFPSFQLPFSLKLTSQCRNPLKAARLFLTTLGTPFTLNGLNNCD